jgi:hypothetical protein
MKIFFFSSISFLLILSVFGLDDTKQHPLRNQTLSEPFTLRSFNAYVELSEHFYLNAMINPSIGESNGVILFTNARDEKNLKEWAAHHLLLGFDLIYIFDHKSEIPLINELENFDTRVIIERCEWENPVKLALMMRAADISRKLNASWMLYLDADEFLILNDYSDVRSLLNAFSHADSIGINWLLFGTNHHVKEPEGLILDNYTSSELILDRYVKSFVKPSQIVDVVNPHFYCIKNPMKMFSIDNKIIKLKPYFNRCKLEYFKSPAYIAHYLYQSEETYLRRKIHRPRDDTGNFRNLIQNIHLYYNDVENLAPKEKYSSQVKLFLMSK